MNLIRNSKLLIMAASALVALSARSVEFETPDWADDTNATYSGWDNFTMGMGEPGNVPDVEGSNAGGTITQSTPGGSVTGSGNIYIPTGPGTFTLVDDVDRDILTVLLQVKSIGELVTDAVMLQYEAEGSMVDLIPAESREIGREEGPFGDTIIHLWSWDLSGMSISDIQIDFAAKGPHLSLDAARLNTLLAPPGAMIAEIKTPSVDRWNYPFNATPGKRPKASVFRSVEEGVGVFRHGTYVIGFSMGSMIPTGHSPWNYAVDSIKIQLLTSSGFEAPYDPTYDSVMTSLPEDHPSYAEDADPGRPIEIFGTGFRNDFTAHTWTETAAYAPDAESDPSVYPAILSDDGEIIDVSLAVDYADPAELQSFVTGMIQDAIPGDLIPEDTWMEFDFNLNTSNALAYVQQGLSDGNLMFTVTSLATGGQGSRTFPEFHTSDSLLGEAPSIVIEYRIIETPTEIHILGINQEGDQWKLTGTASGAVNLGIRWTHDFVEWQEVSDPVFETTEEGHWTWTDPELNMAKKFYQIYTR